MGQKGKRRGLAAVGCGVAVWLACGAAAEPPAKPAADSPPPFQGFGKPANAEELLKRYPFESLADRLAYEPAGLEAFARDGAPTTTDETMKRLTAYEKAMEARRQWNLRTRSLQMLHSDKVQAFVSRQGFGVRRMPDPAPEFLELAAPPTLPFAESSEAAPLKEGEKVTPPGTQLLSNLHDFGRNDFLDPAGFGYVKDRKNVAGFQPHAFRTTPEVPPAGGRPAEKERWAVARLELMSLLKHDGPAVYSADHLPRMDELKEAPTRPLTAFEEKALKAMKGGDDLVTESSGNRILMVGSLRAATQCLDCHQVKRGDLLGAFSYELQRQPAKAEK
jgi:hypothetical protein